ncbi:purine-binding chemotaxis protein CheW [Palleronia aestuarii]|uniref:Purine-binding chemotaxis protein CheW n=1 Tax=Palleronia aestuarii TaxID=568105 RepID=A0A2W7N3F8_9RHOB|nr:chemotaxis protein CheW [Palleronia aestuarii]PZX11364.1 purine-binding chemotaxis protein CheW [Palleronia aestuarii]
MSDTVQFDTALTFSLDGERFAIPVGHVHEIIDPLPVTRAPNADPFAPGLVNVRGAIAPFVDLRRRLGMGPAVVGETSRVLVLDLVVGGEPTKVAMLADDVDEITDTADTDLEALPELGVRWPTHLIRGVARKDSSLIIVLDVDAAFSPTPTQMLRA